MKNFYLLVLTIFGIVSTSFSQITSTGIGGLWSDPLTWAGGVVPGATDDVIIADGTIVTIDQDVTIVNLTIGQGVSGILEYEQLNARTCSLTGDATINDGAIFRSSINGTVTTHVLTTSGNIINNGSIDFSTNGNTAGTRIIFTGALNTSVTGTGIMTDVSAITVDKGTSAAAVVELNTTNFSFQGATSTSGNVQSFLDLLNGTFKVSGTFTMDNGLFTGTGAYIIPSTAGLWLNNSNFTVNARGGDLEVDGKLQVDAGILNIGTGAGNRLLYLDGSVITINGGEVNVASRMSAIAGFGLTYTQTGGVITVATVGNTSGTRASFDVQDQGDNSSFIMSGGTIIIQNANTSGSGNRDFFNDATNINITGGTLQLGNASTPPTQTFYVSGSTPDLIINNSTGGHTIHLLNDVNVYGNTTINAGNAIFLNDNAGTGHILTQRGPTFTNLGTLNGTVPGSTLSFAGTAAQTYGGDGVILSPLLNMIMSNSAGLTITNAIPSDITVFALSMFAGDINTGVSTLAVGTGTATPGVFTYTSGTVIGKFKRWFDATVSARNFPVGIAGATRTANVLFTTAPASGGTLTAQWVSAYGGTSGLPLTEPGFPTITNVASDGYWTITAGDGLSGGVYTGTFTATNVTTVIDYTELVLVKRADGSSPWILDGTHVTTTGSNTTPVLQRTGMVDFSDFGIGGSGTSLPVTIEYFKGQRQGSGNLLNWKINCNNSPSVTMQLERSSDARKFTAINNITASAARCLQAFDYTDAAPLPGTNYYRIRLIDADGKSAYSSIIAILNKEKGFELVSMMPNPVIASSSLSVASAKGGNMNIVITDATGRKLSNRNVMLVAGSNQISLQLADLPAGTYQLTGYSDGAVQTLRFIKN